MCKRKRHFLAFSLSVLLRYSLWHIGTKNETALNLSTKCSKYRLSVSTRKQASAHCLRPDQRVIGLSTTLEVSLSVKASPSLTTTSWSDSKWSKHEWSGFRVHQHIQCLFSCIPLHFNIWYDLHFPFTLCRSSLNFAPGRPGSPVTHSGHALGLSLP